MNGTKSDDIDLPEDHPLLISPEESARSGGDEISLDEVRSGLSSQRTIEDSWIAVARDH